MQFFSSSPFQILTKHTYISQNTPFHTNNNNNNSNDNNNNNNNNFKGNNSHKNNYTN